MTPRTIQYDESLDTIWEEAVYMDARLLTDPLTVDLAPRMTPLVATIAAVRDGQYAVWRAEIVAQARVDAADDQLDDVVGDTGKALDQAVEDHDDPRWKRYIGTSNISRIKAQGLEAEVKTVRTWSESLATEPEESLQKMAPRVSAALTRGDDALNGRDKATGRRRDFMARDKASLVDAFNDLRTDLYGELTKRVVPNRLDRAWPGRFFRKTAAKAAPPRPPAPPQP